MDKLIVNYDDAMTEYPTGCVLSVKSTTMDAVIPGEDYLIVTKEYEAIRRIQTSDNDGYFMAYSTNTKKHPDGRLIHEPFPVPWAAVVGLYKITGLTLRSNRQTSEYRFLISLIYRPFASFRHILPNFFGKND